MDRVQVGADYTKLIKHGGALYDCKRLKTAAFGRIVTLIRKQNLAFKYLEDVRQHISRLPSIDPSIRTLMLAGCPNAGELVVYFKFYSFILEHSSIYRIDESLTYPLSCTYSNNYYK